MDCRTALDILEAARPGSDDLSQPELAGAAAHLAAHADCREEFERRQRLDREIGRAMRDVPLPSGLKERLLAGLSAEGQRTVEAQPLKTTAVSPAQPAEKAWRRRAALRMLAASAAAAAVLAAVLLLSPGERTIGVAGLPADVATVVFGEAFDFDALPAFEERSAAELPVEWETPRLSMAGPKSYRPAGTSPAAALYQFRFPNRAGTVTGYLLVMPAAQVRDAGQLASLAGAATTYPGIGTSARSWKEGGMVYVAVVPSGDNNVNIDVLLRLLTPQTA